MSVELVPDPPPVLEPVRFSRLKFMARSPAHYAAAYQRSTSAMQKGSALHAAILGGPPVIGYPDVRRGKKWEEFAEAHTGAIIVTATDYDRVFGMAEAVSREPEAMRLLKGQHEVEINWSFLGRTCRSHVDVVGDGFVTELKSAATSHPERFAWQARKMGYLAQLAFYREAVLSSGLGTPQAAFVVAVESTPPHPVTVLRLTDRALDQGQRMFRLWFERLLACEAANEWPGYVQSVVDLDVPDDEQMLEFTDGEVADAAAPF